MAENNITFCINGRIEKELKKIADYFNSNFISIGQKALINQATTTAQNRYKTTEKPKNYPTSKSSRRKISFTL